MSRKPGTGTSDAELAEIREEIAQDLARRTGCTIEQARARGWLLGLSLSGPIDPARKRALMIEAGWDE